jgi:hypothetical protein
MYAQGLIAPVLALAAWTLVMLAWLYATRIPAMQKAKMDVGELGRTGARPALPPRVARVADNYNHLHEQPTVFYAVALAAQVAGAVDPIAIGLGWSYVGLRVLHSLVQATVNVIMLRFSIFILSALVLGGLIVRTVTLL